MEMVVCGVVVFGGVYVGGWDLVRAGSDGVGDSVCVGCARRGLGFEGSGRRRALLWQFCERVCACVECRWHLRRRNGNWINWRS